jgi:histidyl-tRNA synthetase
MKICVPIKLAKSKLVIEELKTQEISEDNIKIYLDKLINAKPTEKLKNIFAILETKYNLKLDREFFFDSSLARGLDYYTGPIFELKANPDLASLSIGAGGRYDNLIETFVYPAGGGAGKKIPAVGFSLGLDRLIEAIS